MTGYRSGVIVGDPDAIATLRSLRTSTGTAPAEFVQAAAVAAWSDDAHAAQRREIFSDKRAVLRAAFEAMGYEVVGSRAGIYLWVRVGDDVAITKRLLESGVVVSPGRSFGPVAVRTTSPSTSRSMQVFPGCIPPPIRKQR